jgi:hypothetical protein
MLNAVLLHDILCFKEEILFAPLCGNRRQLFNVKIHYPTVFEPLGEKEQMLQFLLVFSRLFPLCLQNVDAEVVNILLQHRSDEMVVK